MPDDLRIRLLEDKLALKELVDTFSILADLKDTAGQVQLFAEDATVESYVAALRGRAEIAAAFGAYLNTFSTVYHHNGQQTVTITGDDAFGVSYCLVTLIGDTNGQRVSNTSGVIYQDEYVRLNDQWLIARRTSTFAWQHSQAV